MSSRAALASPIPVNTTYDRPSSDRRKNMNSATVPPRTSSQQTPGASGAGSSSRKSQPGERSASQRYGGADANGQASANQAYNEEAGRSRRSEKASSSQKEAARPSAPPVSMPIRSQTASSTPQGPSREASDILNSMLVSQPEVDIDRERERAALSQPHPTATLDDAAATGERGDESRRGGRSRHDYSRREKQTKFGEYILGSTIGEGEFGKVKLGWKQEGGVQVRRCPPPPFRNDFRLFKLTARSRRSLSSSSRRINSAATRRAWPRSCARSTS